MIGNSARLSSLFISSSFIKFQTVKFHHVPSSNFAGVFQVLAQVLQVFQVFLSSSLAVSVLRVT